MRFRNILYLVLFLICQFGIVGSANAQQALPQVKRVQPVPGDPFVDFQIDDCQGQYGFGAFIYDFPDYIIRLSDFCFFPDQGIAVAAEMLSNLELTVDGVDAQLYEVLSSGDDRWSRETVEILSWEDSEDCPSPEPISEFEYWMRSEEGSKNFHHGYLAPNVSPLPKVKTGRVGIRIDSKTQTELANKTLERGGLPPPGYMWSSINWSDQSGTFDIKEGFGETYGASTGQLSVQALGDGSFVGSGFYSAESSRLKGHNSDDMVSISGEIPYIRGHFLGKNGSRIRGHGLVKGSFLTAGGETHPFRAVAVLEGCLAEEEPSKNRTIESAHQFSGIGETIAPEAVLDRFLQTCTQVLSDPDAYLAGIESPGPAGERVTSVSPDRNLVSVYEREGAVHDEVELHIVGNRQVRDCSVIGEFHGADTEELAGQFRQVVESRDGLTISGGHAPQDYVDGGALTTEEDIYLYAIDGLWPELGLIATAHVIAGELQLYVQRTMN